MTMDFDSALQVVVESIRKVAGPEAGDRAAGDHYTALSEVGFDEAGKISLLVSRIDSVTARRGKPLNPMWGISISPYTSVRDVANHVMYGTDSTGPKIRRDDAMTA